MSKYEQCSAWDARPLREAQLHYAALDAYVCLVVYEKLHELYKFDNIMYTDNDFVRLKE